MCYLIYAYEKNLEASAFLMVTEKTYAIANGNYCQHPCVYYLAVKLWLMVTLFNTPVFVT